jgi:hypothetical protein
MMKDVFWDTTQCGSSKKDPTFRRIHITVGWKRYVLSKRLFFLVELHGVVSEKTASFGALQLITQEP